MRTAMRIVVGVGDLVQRTGDGQEQVGYLVAGWSRGRVTLCVVCTMHKEMVCRWFDIKITGTVSPVLASKPVVIVSPGLASKLVATDFPVWASKPVATVW
jgi:hypothetical protein